jgi:N-acetyl-anhydromuramyl-L-alanine amidase AmpD
MKTYAMYQCLLDRFNAVHTGKTTVGSQIAATGQQCLWGDRQGAVVDTVVIHYVSACEVEPRRPFDLGNILSLFCSLGVSSHYLISREGAVYRLVPDEMRAWHSGASIMPPPDNRQAVNAFSLGIELMATETSGFTDAQYASLGALAQKLEQKFGAMHYVGHDTIAGERAVALGLRKTPKPDPGPLFGWERFYREKSSTHSTINMDGHCTDRR